MNINYIDIHSLGELTPEYLDNAISDGMLSNTNCISNEENRDLIIEAINSNKLELNGYYHANYFSISWDIVRIFETIIAVTPLNVSIKYNLLFFRDIDYGKQVSIILKIADVLYCVNFRLTDSYHTRIKNNLDSLVSLISSRASIANAVNDMMRDPLSYANVDTSSVDISLSLINAVTLVPAFNGIMFLATAPSPDGTDAHNTCIIDSFGYLRDKTVSEGIDIAWANVSNVFKPGLFYANVLRDSYYKELNFNIIENESIDDTVSRFRKAIWFEKIRHSDITLAGLGGIGSYVAFLLARLKPHSLYLFDDDRIEATNMSGQMYGLGQVNMYKVDAAADNINEYATTDHVYAISERIDETTPPSKIMISGFDSISARKVYFENWLKLLETLEESERKECIFIDGRLAAEDFQILCVRGDDSYNIERYKKEFIFDPSEAAHTICSYKQTSHIAAIIAGVMVNLFTNFIVSTIDNDLRELPFFTEYNAETMVMNTQL